MISYAGNLDSDKKYVRKWFTIGKTMIMQQGKCVFYSGPETYSDDFKFACSHCAIIRADLWNTFLLCFKGVSAPIFEDGLTTFDVDDDAVLGSSVVVISVLDDDNYDTIAFSLSGPQAQYFEIVNYGNVTGN